MSAVNTLVSNFLHADMLSDDVAAILSTASCACPCQCGEPACARMGVMVRRGGSVDRNPGAASILCPNLRVCSSAQTRLTSPQRIKIKFGGFL